MRVLFWSETFWPRVGGVERLAAGLLPALRERGHEFAVVTWDEAATRAPRRFEGIDVHRFAFFAGSQRDGANATMAQLEEVRTLKRQFDPDLVHVNSLGRSAWFHLATNAANAPTLVTLHQPLQDDGHASQSVPARLLGVASWIACCSHAVKASVQRVHPAIEHRTSVIYNALPADDTMPQAMPFEPPVLLFAGRLVRAKGLGELLDELPRLFARFPDTRLVVAGDGPLRAGLESRTIARGLASNVRFAGEVPPKAVGELIANATVVLVPSQVEGFGLVALEAAMMARPVVAMRVGGLPEVVDHDTTGILVDGGDMRGFVNAIARLLEDRPAARRMGARARERARERFEWRQHVGAYDALYRRLAS